MLHFCEKSEALSELLEGKGCPDFVFVREVMQKRVKGADHGVEFRLLQENVRIGFGIFPMGKGFPDLFFSCPEITGFDTQLC